MTSRRIASLNRYRTVGGGFLEHSEWIRKLQTPSLVGIASVLTIPFGIFIITPYVVMNVSGPSALLSLLIAFIIMIISGMHMNELLCSMPKSCLLYNFTYATFGEIPAFLNLLFHGLFEKHFAVEMPYHLETIFATKIDFFAVLAIICAAIILCCSIRVMATVSIIMVVVCALATNSTAFVGFYFADPNNWLAAGFVKHNTTGVIKGASNYLSAYVGIEALSFLMDETKNPRKRLPSLMLFMIITLTLIMFLTTTVITLVTDISTYPSDMLFPDIFDKLSVPSAKLVWCTTNVTTRMLLDCFFFHLLINLMYRWSGDDESSEMISTYETLRNIIIAQQEVRCDRCFQKLPSMGLLSNVEEGKREELNERKSSQYRAFKTSQSLTENLKETIMKFHKDGKRPSLPSLDSYNFSHNCLRSSCSPCSTSTANIKKHKFHIFEYDIPKMLYWNKYPASMKSSENFDKTDYKSSMRALVFFIVISIATGFLLLKTERDLTTAYAIPLMLFACIALGCVVLNAARQTVNPASRERSYKTPVFPYLTLFAIFLATLTACTTADHITVVALIAWIVFGLVLYALYGYRHSKEGTCTV
ncbi:unnamed protein product [Litomosoides sigmodontis]|uniref:Cationic amino acid transporter C-terminal domain-containing protein n=1 Tax=Litomosoides sigmodontis TaxID=42156 RepID=A0A3P6SJ50_LITSI|nr:unnamed protein product [Litomosoides sigmodontis]